MGAKLAMKRKIHLSIILTLAASMVLSVVSISTVHASVVWQWSVPVVGGVDHAGPATAYLWIPQSCKRVRGVVISQNNMEEEMILENPKFRAAMAQLDFAEVWVSPAFNGRFLFDQGAGDVFNSFMSDLAKDSGYSELNYVPVAPMGHSAQASWPYYFAAWNPGRTLCALSVSGQWPYFRDKTFAPDIWGDKTIDYVPCLETMGEYESADTWSREGLWERQQHPLMPLSMAAGPAQSHFFAADSKIDYLILYIKKAAQYRIPKGWNGNSAPTLIPIDPTKTGWLVNKWRKDDPPTAPPAPVAEYKGDPKDAFWFFDQEMADATTAYESVYKNMKVDLIGYVQDSAVVPQRNTHQQVNLKFEPDADGVTFHLQTKFLDTVPGESPRPAGWTGLPAGSPVGHASGGGPIVINRITGPFEKLSADTFALRYEKGMGADVNHLELWFAATHPGDAEYKPIVQQAQMVVPIKNTVGNDQQITFPAIPDQKPGAQAIKLAATTDSGMPVYYFVESGPAILNDDNTLTLTQIPPRAVYPVKVTVVAWQYGRSTAPQVKTADPVRQTFNIVK